MSPYRIVHAALVVCLLGLFVTSASLAQDKPDTALQVLRKDHGTFMVINDPLPMVRTLLASERFQRAMTTGKFGAFVTREAGKPVDPKQWLAQVEANQRWVPDEIVLAVSEDGMKQSGNLINLILLGALEKAATDAVETKAADELRPQFLAMLQQTRVPSGLIWVRFRDAEDAKGLFALIASGVDEITPTYPFLKSAPDAVTIDVGMLDFVDQKMLGAVAAQFMGLADPALPDSKAAAAAMGKIRFTARLQVVGRGLLLTIGDPSTAPALQRYDERLASKSNALVLGEWKAQPLVDGFRAAMKTWNAYRDTRTGAALLEVDADGLLLDLETNAMLLDKVSPHGVFHGDPTTDGFELTSMGQIVQPATDVRQSPLLRLIPPNVPMYSIDHTQSLADILGAQLISAEGRADMKALGAEFNPNATNLQQKSIVESYYASFQPFRQAILRDMPALYEPSTVVVMDTHGKIDSLQLRAPGERFDLKNMRVPELAIAGGARDPQKAIANLQTVLDRLADGFYANAGKEREKGVAAYEQRDLGLGVPTYVLSRPWIDALTKGSGVEWRYQGDQEIHFFAVGNAVVVSTSPRLSKEMIAPRENAVALPWTKDKLVARAVFKGEALAAFAETAGDFVRELSQLNPNRNRRADRQAEELFPALVDLMLYLDRIDAVGTDAGETRTGYARIVFREPPAR